MGDTHPAEPPPASPCQACGACCDYDPTWPRFTTEDDAQLQRLPRKLVNFHDTGMHCVGNRCSALVGVVGEHTACAVYRDRPDVCRACLPGDDACTMARTAHGLPELPPSERSCDH